MQLLDCEGNQINSPILCIHWQHLKNSAHLQTQETQDKSPECPKCLSEHSSMPKSSSRPLFRGSHYLRNGTSPGRSVWPGCSFLRTKIKVFFSSQWNTVPFQEFLCRAGLGNHKFSSLTQGLIPRSNSSPSGATLLLLALGRNPSKF